MAGLAEITRMTLVVMAFASMGGVSTLTLNEASGREGTGVPFAACLNAVELDIAALKLSCVMTTSDLATVVTSPESPRVS
jgi:hypothetical protein